MASATCTTNSTYFPCDLADIPKADLHKMKRAIESELKGRQSVDDLLSSLEKSYDAIDWGYGDWKDEKTSDAVRELEDLSWKQARDICDKILALTDADEKWKAALKFSVLQSNMISTADVRAYKRVNGSCGEWCPDTAEDVLNLWEKLVQKDSPLPSESTRSEVCNNLQGILGDYDAGLDHILAKVKESSANKRQKRSPEPETIDLVESP